MLRTQIPINVFELGLKNGLIREPEYVIAYAEFLLGAFPCLLLACQVLTWTCAIVIRCPVNAYSNLYTHPARLAT